MTFYYTKNLCGFRPTESQMENIPCPRFELLGHVTLKTVQAGVLIGGGIVGPIMSVARGKRDLASIKETSYTCGKNGAIVGLIIGPIMTISKAAVMDSPGAWDRAYRLRYSSQNFVDRVSILGALTGMGIAHYKGEKLAKGALFGFAGGVVVGGLLNAFF